jgi:hypothetical protein
VAVGAEYRIEEIALPKNIEKISTAEIRGKIRVKT